MMSDHLSKLLLELEKEIPPFGKKHHVLSLAFDLPLTTLRLTLFQYQSTDIVFMEDGALRATPEKFVREVERAITEARSVITPFKAGLYTGFPRTEQKFRYGK